jgi:nicotinamide riboside transporter PnuC
MMNISNLEIVGVLFYLISVYFAVTVNKLTWLFSIVGQSCYFFLYLTATAYSNAALQIFFIYYCIMGWIF